MLYNTEKCDKLDTFNRLKIFAKPEYKDLFKKEIFCNDVVFFIGDTRIWRNSSACYVYVGTAFVPWYAGFLKKKRATVWRWKNNSH